MPSREANNQPKSRWGRRSWVGLPDWNCSGTSQRLCLVMMKLPTDLLKRISYRQEISIIIYLAYHWIKELTQFGYIDVQSKRTKLDLADVFTKLKPVDVGVAKRLFTKLLGYDDFRNESESKYDFYKCLRLCLFELWSVYESLWFMKKVWTI